tara:strand:+ start:23 stop:409 length:387 start_codon:yes stop_codon:yes gene_type:complete
MAINRQYIFLFIGRSILGLYFILPGIMKITYWNAHIELMNKHHMILVPYLLILAAMLEMALGGMLLMNYKTFYSALCLVGLVVLINLNLHDFWNTSGIEKAHELQNFIKNIGIIGGLLILTGQKYIDA